MKISIFGHGVFGSAVAVHLSLLGHDIEIDKCEEGELVFVCVPSFAVLSVLKNVKDSKLRDCIEKYDLLLLQIKVRTERESDFMNRYMDDIRIAPFDYYYRTNSASSDSFFNIKSSSMNSVVVTYHKKNYDLFLNKIYVPENLKLKKFDKELYLNRMLQLNGIRKSTNVNQAVQILNAGTVLLQNIERAYPHINEAH